MNAKRTKAQRDYSKLLSELSDEAAEAALNEFQQFINSLKEEAKNETLH